MLSLQQMELFRGKAYGRRIDESPARDGNPDEDCVLRLCHCVWTMVEKRTKRRKWNRGWRMKEMAKVEAYCWPDKIPDTNDWPEMP